MKSTVRDDHAKGFEDIAEKINDLAMELRDNKDVREFLKEMEGHQEELGAAIGAFRKNL